MTDLCSAIVTDLLRNTHACDKGEGHETQHGCHCGYTWQEEEWVPVAPKLGAYVWNTMDDDERKFASPTCYCTMDETMDDHRHNCPHHKICSECITDYEEET